MALQDGATCAHCASARGRFAAIDIGTVTCRLLVADVEGGELHELARGYRITNLGEGVDATGELKREAMERVADAVSGFMQTVSEHATDEAPVQVTCVATSAARDAKNAADFAALLGELGVTLSVIPGEREAGLSFRGASRGFEGSPIVMVDVGGGSTEVVAGTAGRFPDAVRSFDVGCRRVTERFFRSDPPADDELSKAALWIREQMSPYAEKLKEDGFEGARVVAVAGTATSVVSVREAMEVYDSAKVNGAHVSRADLAAVHDRLRAMTCEERRHVVGLDPGRAPVIVAGTLILSTVVDLLAADGFTASESDILQGIILNAAESAAR